ncbi:MAG: zinc-binding alcohol dehydrogenase family protein [Candidatus Dadabacteria bacterium]|nr:MAG: zinc-binding alcohol dehydrogenase family protein [Candidatus Dadabacteria bacterium]
MRAALLEKIAAIETRPLKLVDLPMPEPADNEVLIMVSVCGVCRTDLHIIEGDIPAKRLPIVPGHQIVGTVKKTGRSVKKFQAGERVGVAWLASTCKECEFCTAARENLCPGSVYTGYHRHGGFAEYVTAVSDYVYSIPESFSDQEAAPLLCAGIIGYRALKRSAFNDGKTLGIYGFGSSAHIVAKLVLARSGRLFVATRNEKHRKLARELGAEVVVGGYDNFPEPVDSAIIFAPAGELVPVALKNLKKGGTVALAGIHMSEIPAMDYESCLFHEKNLVSVEANTREDGRELLEAAAAAGLKPELTEFPLNDANQALIQLKYDGFKGTAVLNIAGS